jgi:polysaccharide transporter, PST family
MAESIVRLGLGFLLSILVARHLGPHDYGLFNLVLSYVHILIPFYTFGVDEGLIKMLVRYKDSSDLHKIDKIMATAFFVKLSGGLMAIVVIMSAMLLPGDQDPLVIKATLLLSGIMLFRAIDVVDDWYQALLAIKKLALVRILALLLISLLKFYFVYTKREWIYFIWISCAEVLLIEVLYLVIYFRDKKGSFFRIKLIDIDIFREILKSSLPMLLILILNYALSRVDQIMIGLLVGNNELGKYAVAVKLIDIWQFFPFAIINTMFPLILKSYFDANSQRSPEYILRLKKLYSVLTWSSLLISIFFFLFSNRIIEFFYGAAYDGAGLYLGTYCWLTVFTFFTFAQTKIYTIENAISDGVFISVIALFLNIIGNFILLEKFGAIGAIYSSILAYTVSILLVSIRSQVTRRNLKLYIQSILFPFELFFKHNKRGTS